MTEDDSKKLAVLNERMEQFEKNFEKRFDTLEVSLGKFMEASEKRFASKWVENGMVFVGSLVVTAIVGAVLTLVIK